MQHQRVSGKWVIVRSDTALQRKENGQLFLPFQYRHFPWLWLHRIN